jgi:hypothetical protein
MKPALYNAGANTITNLKLKYMTTDEIMEQAKVLDATNFVEYLETNGIDYEILDADNILDYNDEYLNLAVDGFDEGDSLLFFDGKLSN